MSVAAEIIQLRGKLGVKGVTAVKCRVIEGPDKGKIVARNVAGPVKAGDVILLKETGIDIAGGMQGR